MSITTYSELQTAVQNWLARDDLNSYIPDFITIFEAAACRRLKVRPQETTTTLTPSSGVATLPTDYLGHRRVTWSGTPNRDLDYVHPSMWGAMWPESPSGTPAIYTIEGGYLKVKPLDDTALTFTYNQKTAAVSGTLNWLFSNHPDAYLFGALCEANAFNKGKAFEQASIWKQRRDEVFQEISMLDFNERSGMAIRVMSVTP